MKQHRGRACIGLACFVGLLAALCERRIFAEPPAADVAQPQATSPTVQTPPSTSASASAQTESSPSDIPLQFRRVHVPERAIGAGSDARQRFLPMKADEFERLLRQFGSPASPETPPALAELRSARYTATLSDDSLVAGQATLEIESFAKRSVLLPLDPCRLGIENPHWAATNAISAADAGARGDGDAVALGARVDGKLALRVSASGTLAFDWTLRGQRDAGGELIFPLRLPRCPSTKLQLTLPAEFAPIVDQAIVTALSDASPSRQDCRE